MVTVNSIEKSAMQQWRKNKFETIFMLSALVLAVLTFLKPEADFGLIGLAASFGISVLTLVGILFAVWWFFIRS